MPEVKVDLDKKPKGYVEAVGPKDADIVILGEAPGRDEARKGKPFVGSSGRLLNSLLEKAGIQRHDCYLTNVIKTRPPGNNFSIYYDKSKPKGTLLTAQANIRDEIRKVNPNVIIPLGNEALRAITGNECKKISNWRGSIIDTPCGKAVPTYHPAYILRVWKYNPIAIFDLQRALKESRSPKINLPERSLNANPDYNEIMDFIDFCREQEYLSFDIETLKPEACLIDKIGIAPNEKQAMSIPLRNKDGSSVWSLTEEQEILLKLESLLSDPTVKKIAQNAPYDIIFLERLGLPVTNLWMDTMAATRMVNPEYPRRLSFLSSIYTREPFYKEEIDEQRGIYNCKDAAVTYEVAQGLRKDMESFGVADFYFEKVNPLIELYIRVQKMGVRVDPDFTKKMKAQLQKEIEEMRARLKELTGEEINVYSVKDMRSYIYDKLGMKPRYNDNNNLDTSKDTLKEFYRKTGREEFKVMMELRKVRSRNSTYVNAEIDEDGRIRSTFDPAGTYTGRIASKKAVNNKGMNLQNVTKEYRDMFIPDEGFVFLGADLGQAENRVVAYLSEDSKMVSVVEGEGDIHYNNAAMIFDKPVEEVTYEERQLGKRITHGCLLPEAEVLTPRGWTQFKDLEKGVPTMQYNQKTKEMNFVIPKILEYDYNGIMYQAGSNGHKQIYSPEHRIPYVEKRAFRRGERDLRWKRAEDISEMTRPSMMPVSGEFNPENPRHMHPDNARILAMVQADGSIEKYGGIRFSFSKRRKQKRCLELLDRAGIPYNFQKSQREDYLRIFIEAENAKPILQYLGKEKTFSNWILTLPQITAKALLEETEFWDGNRNNDNAWWYFTTIENNAVAIQTLAHLCGYTASIQVIENNKYKNSYGDPDTSKLLYRVNIMNKQYIGLRKEHWSKVKYKGKIYCLNVPEEAFLVRYNNQIHVTLNSNYMMGPITFAKYAETTTAQAKKYLKKYHDTYPGVRRWHKKVERQVRLTRTLENTFGRKCKFNGRLNSTTFRAAVAFEPQSTVADTIHRATRRMWARLPHPARFVFNLHDAVTIQCLPEQVEECSKIMKEELTAPLEVNGHTISIPAEPVQGDTWKEID